MKLDKWIEENLVKDTMLYNKAAYSSFKQMEEVANFWGGAAEVISSHTSKSIKLPVIKSVSSAGAGTLIIRDNFHDIKVSFICPEPINHDLFGITVGTSEYLSPTYFEGFNPDDVFGGFHVGVDRFSVCLYDYNHVKELCSALLAYLLTTDRKESLRLFAYKSDLVRKLNRDEGLALGYGLPVVKTGSLFRFFSSTYLDRPVVVPINEQILSFILSYKFFDYKNGFETLSFPVLDFTQGVPFEKEAWLKTIARIVESQRKINTAYLDKGACFEFLGIDEPTRALITSLGLGKTFTSDKD